MFGVVWDWISIVAIFQKLPEKIERIGKEKKKNEKKDDNSYYCHVLVPSEKEKKERKKRKKKEKEKMIAKCCLKVNEILVQLPQFLSILFCPFKV